MITVKFDDSQVQDALNRLKQKMTTGRRAVMSEIGEYLQESTIQRFEKGEGPDGKKWAGNADSTIDKMLSKTKGNRNKRGGLSARGKKRASSKKTLIGETKQLKNVNYEATKDQVEVGSSRIYAAVQHFGAAQGAFGRTKRNGPIPWGTIPARPFLGFSDDDRSEILDIIEGYLDV